jgi:hypothetical protein
MQARLLRWRVPIGVATAAVAGGCVTRMIIRPKPEPNRSDEASRARLAVSREAPRVVRVAYRDAEGRVCHTGLEPSTSGTHTGLLLIRASLFLDSRIWLGLMSGGELTAIRTWHPRRSADQPTRARPALCQAPRGDGAAARGARSQPARAARRGERRRQRAARRCIREPTGA